MQPLTLDLEGLHEFQQNRAPYLMIDCATAVIPGKSALGYKNLTDSEWFFAVHFPGDPNMPGMLQIEAMVQLSALIVLTLEGNKGKPAYLLSATNLKFARKVIPGDRLDFVCELRSFNRGIGDFSGKGTVDGALACSADFKLVLPHILSQYKVVPSVGKPA